MTPRLRAAPPAADGWPRSHGGLIWEGGGDPRGAGSGAVRPPGDRTCGADHVRRLGRAEIGAYEPPTLEELRRHQQQGRAWVAVSAHDQPVAYLLADIVDGNAHIEQVSCIHTMPAAGSGRR